MNTNFLYTLPVVAMIACITTANAADNNVNDIEKPVRTEVSNVTETPRVDAEDINILQTDEPDANNVVAQYNMWI